MAHHPVRTYSFPRKSLGTAISAVCAGIPLPHAQAQDQAGVRRTPSYDIFNFRFGLEAEGWSASLFVNNLFNEYAPIFFSERYAQPRATVLPPRTFGINFRKDFNW